MQRESAIFHRASRISFCDIDDIFNALLSLFHFSGGEKNVQRSEMNPEFIQMEPGKFQRLLNRAGIEGNISICRRHSRSGSGVSTLRCYKNIPSIPARIHHVAPARASRIFAVESRVVRLRVPVPLIGLSRSLVYPGLAEKIISVFAGENLCLLVTELLKQERYATALQPGCRTAARNFHELS